MSLTVDDTVYIAKLRKSGRPKKLIAAFIVLLLAMRRIGVQRTKTAIAAALAASVQVLAKELAVYVGAQVGEEAAAADIAPELLTAITTHLADASDVVDPEVLADRIGLIAQAELQRATMEFYKNTVPSTATITRRSVATIRAVRARTWRERIARPGRTNCSIGTRAAPAVSK